MEIPEDRMHFPGPDPSRAGAEMLLLAAVKLFELGRLSSGAAAEFAGISKPELLELLPKLGVAAVNVTEEYLQGEVRLVDVASNFLPLPSPEQLNGPELMRQGHDGRAL